MFELVKAIIINSADHQQLRAACFADAREPSSQQTRAKLSIREFHLISTQPCLHSNACSRCTIIERRFNVQSKSTSSLEIIGADVMFSIVEQI
jgi:hypothetical protein